MKNNKKIISEISRLHELMGVKSNLLNEQPIGVLDDVLKKIAPDIFKSVDSPIANAYRKMANTKISDIERKQGMEEFIRLSKTEMPELYAQIRRIALDDSEIKAVIDNLFTSEQKQTFSNNVETLLKRGDTDEEVMSRYKNSINRSDLTQSERAALEQRMRDEISTIRTRLVDSGEIAPLADDAASTVTKRTRITDDPTTPKTGDEVADDAAKAGDEVADDASKAGDEVANVGEVKTEIESWGKWDDIPDYTLEQIDELVQYNGFSRWLSDVFTSQETVLLNKVKRFNKLSKAYADSVEKGVSVEVQSRIENEMIKELQSITETSLRYRKEAEIWIKNTVDGFEKTPKGQIINPSERRFAEWSKKVTNSDGTLKNPSEIRKINIKEKVSSDLVVGFKEAFSQWGKWGESLKNKALGKFSKTPPAPSTIQTAGPKNWFLRGSRRGNPWLKWNRKNWDDVIDGAGLSAAKRQYIYELLFRYFQWNIIWGFGETLFQSINAAMADEETRNKIQGCIDARALPTSDTTRPEKLKQYCESIKTIREIQLLHYWEDPMTVVLIKNMIFDWGDKDDGLIDTFTDLFPGKLDDVVHSAWNFFAGTRDSKTIQAWQDAIEQTTESAGENFEQAQGAVEQAAENNGIDLPTGEGETETSTEDSSTPGSLEHAKSNLGSDATQDGEYYISSGLKFKWNPTTNTYDWVE